MLMSILRMSRVSFCGTCRRNVLDEVSGKSSRVHGRIITVVMGAQKIACSDCCWRCGHHVT